MANTLQAASLAAWLEVEGRRCTALVEDLKLDYTSSRGELKAILLPKDSQIHYFSKMGRHQKTGEVSLASLPLRTVAEISIPGQNVSMKSDGTITISRTSQ